jgi:hypothetical protein
VSGNGRDVLFVNASGASVVNYNNLSVVDADGTTVPAKFEAIDGGLRLRIDDHAARYPLTIDPIAQQAYLKASNTDANDNFGSSVAVSGDTVVVGTPGESSNAVGVNGNQANNSASGSGAVYTFNILLATDPCAGQQPVITQHPASQSVTPAESAGFTAAATSPSGSALSYRWQRNGVDLVDGGNIAGASTPTLTISPAALADNGGAYACIVTNSCGSTSTRPVGLGVTAAPRCLADLGSQGGLPGADGFLDNNDFIVFIDEYFSHTGCP